MDSDRRLFGREAVPAQTDPRPTPDRPQSRRLLLSGWNSSPRSPRDHVLRRQFRDLAIAALRLCVGLNGLNGLVGDPGTWKSGIRLLGTSWRAGSLKQALQVVRGAGE